MAKALNSAAVRQFAEPLRVDDVPVPRPGSLGVDDPRLFCEALLVTLRATMNPEQVETATSFADALERLRRRPAPGLVQIDPKMPDADCFRGLIQRAKAAPGVAIVMVLVPNEDRVVTSVLQVGPGLGPRQRPAVGFIDGFEHLWAHDRHAPEPCAKSESKRRSTLDQPDAVDLMKSLTPQQARILHLVCEGKFNKQIAYHLDISEGTVKAHLTAILRKLNVQNCTQAVLIAQSAGLASTALDFRGEASP